MEQIPGPSGLQQRPDSPIIPLGPIGPIIISVDTVVKQRESTNKYGVHFTRWVMELGMILRMQGQPGHPDTLYTWRYDDDENEWFIRCKCKDSHAFTKAASAWRHLKDYKCQLDDIEYDIGLKE